MISKTIDAATARILLASVAAAAFAIAVASCGHGASSVSPAAQSHGGDMAIQFHIAVPTSATSSSPGVVRPHYVSSGTTQAGVTVTPQGGAPYPTTYFPCTSAACTGTVHAPVGTDIFTVSLYGGNRISPDTLLSTGATTATIQAGITNYVNVTFNPVVSSILLSVSPQNLPPGSPANATVTVDATDASGQTIIGPGTFVNSSGAPLAINLSTFDKLANGRQGHSTTLQPATLNAPPTSGPTQVTLSYDGNPQLAATTINASPSVAINGTITPATLTVAASPSPSPTGCAVTATPNPKINFVRVPPNQLGLAFVGDSIAKGPDGNLWSSDGSRRALRLTTALAIDAFDIPGSGALSRVTSVTAGPAGGSTVWFADVGTQSLGRITVGTTPSIALFKAPDIENGHQSAPVAISAGPDGNMWFTDRGSDYLGNIAPLLGSFNEYPIPVNPNRIDQGVVVLPSGQMWFVEQGTGRLGEVQISSLQLGSVNAINEYKPQSSQPNELRTITASPDGNVWFVEPVSNKIGRVNVAANPITIDEFTVPSAGAQPDGIAAGPDGAIWFTEYNARRLGRIPFNAGLGTAPQEYVYPFVAPAGITTGPDCNLWVTDQAANARIGRIKF